MFPRNTLQPFWYNMAPMCIRLRSNEKETIQIQLKTVISLHFHYFIVV